MPVDPASRLAFEVKRRRAQLALSQLEVQAAGGPSNTTQTNIENAVIKTLTPNTAKKIDRGLQWLPGSALRIWRGEGGPVVAEAGLVDGAHLELTGHVGGPSEDGEYVAAPGARIEGGLTDDEVLRELRAMQQRIAELSERLEKRK